MKRYEKLNVLPATRQKARLLSALTGKKIYVILDELLSQALSNESKENKEFEYNGEGVA